MALLFNIIAIWVFYNWAVTLRYNTQVPASYYNIPKWCVTLAREAGILVFVKKNLHVAKDVIIILLTLSEDVF